MASELALISIGQYEVLTSDVTLSGGRRVPEWTFIDSAIWTASQSPSTPSALASHRS